MTKCDAPQEKDNSLTACVVDEQRRSFLLAAIGVLGGIGVACALTPFISSWLPSRKAKSAVDLITVDVSHLSEGQQMTVEWQGKPVWILRRSDKVLRQLSYPNSQLRDPDSFTEQQPRYAKNNWRSRNPAYLVLIGLCTHLGCSPRYVPHLQHSSKNAGGFYCPCHGSEFDLAGRVLKGMPAPLNLEVPPYYFVNEHLLVIGKDNAKRSL